MPPGRCRDKRPSLSTPLPRRTPLPLPPRRRRRMNSSPPDPRQRPLPAPWRATQRLPEWMADAPLYLACGWRRLSTVPWNGCPSPRVRCYGPGPPTSRRPSPPAPPWFFSRSTQKDWGAAAPRAIRQQGAPPRPPALRQQGAPPRTPTGTPGRHTSLTVCLRMARPLSMLSLLKTIGVKQMICCCTSDVAGRPHGGLYMITAPHLVRPGRGYAVQSERLVSAVGEFVLLVGVVGVVLLLVVGHHRRRGRPGRWRRGHRGRGPLARSARSSCSSASGCWSWAKSDWWF